MLEPAAVLDEPINSRREDNDGERSESHKKELVEVGPTKEALEAAYIKNGEAKQSKNPSYLFKNRWNRTCRNTSSVDEAI